MKQGRQSVLEIKEFKTQFHLGCEAWEREHSQQVNFDILYEFDSSPLGELSDSIADTLCYAHICESLRELTEKHYKLVEHIASDAIEKVKPLLVCSGKLTIRVHKIKPPVDGLSGGVIYNCTEYIVTGAKLS